jgi:hypothetical protein
MALETDNPQIVETLMNDSDIIDKDEIKNEGNNSDNDN